MPHFFVEGFQHDRPSAPLYVYADNEESAKARARELGMVVTGVRGAKEEAVQKSVARWAVISHHATFLLFVYLPVIMVYGYWFIDRKSQIWPSLGIVFVFISNAFLGTYSMFRQQSRTIEMLVAEVKDLCCFVEQLKTIQPAQPERQTSEGF